MKQMDRPEPGRWRRSVVAGTALCLLPVLAFYATLWREMRSVPMFDDYHAILYFVLNLRELPGVGSRLAYLAAAQHDEYKLIVEHAIVAADWALTGHVHLGLLMALGNILTIGLGWLLWANVSDEEQSLARRLLLFAPVMCLLFQLNFAENLDWAMCGLQTLPVLFFSMAALHFALRAEWKNYLLASLCAALACLSSANGFLVAPIGFAIFAARRQFYAFACWAVAIASAMVLYLYQYQRFTPEQFAKPVSFADKALFFFSFLGGAFENMHHFPLRHASTFVGLLMFLGLGLACATRAHKRQPYVVALAVWCVLTAAVVAQKRSYQGLDLSLTGRYKIYSDLLLICCYLLWLQWAREQRRDAVAGTWLFRAVLAASMLFCLIADVFGYKYLAHRRERVAEGFREYREDPAHHSPEISLGGEPFAGYEPEFSRQVLTKALAIGIYRLPSP